MKKEINLNDYSINGICDAKCDRKVVHTDKLVVIVCDGCKRVVMTKDKF